MAPSSDPEIQSVQVSPKHDSDSKALEEHVNSVESTEESTPVSFRKTLFGYVKTKQFWLVLVFG
jgi:hypothetical protein